jgi:hypothetical protein
MSLLKVGYNSRFLKSKKIMNEKEKTPWHKNQGLEPLDKPQTKRMAANCVNLRWSGPN